LEKLTPAQLSQLSVKCPLIAQVNCGKKVAAKK